ncbi:hypothetical protein A2Y99_05110 [Candidatus Gottesmanbacteria bacterium RBG_13_37_7]|uniref:Soluble ligand binding domain-containing protein n=1 Tax=Candidatus Gottesmanbacteria bacterium RBG_13_37_7 TaxID=1798369 RepID=A0A1F5YJX0_9BACT|nr:MAG: hypothetical protein A2Y99_05110 [Candidatus Gottesmanbacteria bacterium RBG_13_37_7]
MPKEKGSAKTSFFKKDELVSLAKIYRFPLIMALAGFILLSAAIILLLRTQDGENQVVFSTDSSESAKLKIVIDIEGEVVSPGVYEMRDGDRINDALILSGGLTEKADRDYLSKNLNRAAKLPDGGKIYIPSVKEAVANRLQSISGNMPATNNLLGVSTGKTNINSSSQKELEALPGVGPVTAEKIMQGRPYQNIDELKTRKIVGDALFAKIRDLLTAF